MQSKLQKGSFVQVWLVCDRNSKLFPETETFFPNFSHFLEEYKFL